MGITCEVLCSFVKSLELLSRSLEGFLEDDVIRKLLLMSRDILEML